MADNGLKESLYEIMDEASHDLSLIFKTKFPYNGKNLVERDCLTPIVNSVKKSIRVCQVCKKKSMCDTIPIPKNYLMQCMPNGTTSTETPIRKDDGFNADVCIFVEFLSPDRDEQYVSKVCKHHFAHQVPQMGVIYVHPHIIHENFRFKDNVNAFKREALSIMSSNLVNSKFFIDSKTNEPLHDIYYTNYSEEITKDVKGVLEFHKDSVTNFQGYKHPTTRPFYTTPLVKKLSREHFGCPDLTGLLIQDNYLDEATFGNEILTPMTNYEYAVVSNFTLYLLEDTGWYIPEYSIAQEFNFHKNIKCTLFKDGCYQVIKDSKNDEDYFPFCNFRNQQRCTEDRVALLSCSYMTRDFVRRPKRKVSDMHKCALFNMVTYLIFPGYDGVCTNQNNMEFYKKYMITYGILLASYGKNSMCVRMKGTTTKLEEGQPVLDQSDSCFKNL